MDKTEGLRKYAHQKSIDRQKTVLEQLEKMKASGMPLNFNSVAKYTGASKSYLYGNPCIRETIKKYRISNECCSQKSKDVLIKVLKKRVRELERELESYNGNNYRTMYEELKKRYNELEKQIKTIYDY